MSDMVFLPVQCPICHKTSVFSLAARTLETTLASGGDLYLTCAFDGAAWLARSAERKKLSRLMRESKMVEGREFLRNDPATIEHRYRLK